MEGVWPNGSMAHPLLGTTPEAIVAEIAVIAVIVDSIQVINSREGNREQTWQVLREPEVTLNQLVQHCKVVSVCLIIHDPPSSNYLQLPSLHKPAHTTVT